MLLSGVQRVVGSGQKDYCPNCREMISYQEIDRTFPEGRESASMEEVSEWHKEAEDRGEEIYETIYSPCQKCGEEEREAIKYRYEEKDGKPSPEPRKRLPICPRCEKVMQVSGQMMID